METSATSTKDRLTREYQGALAQRQVEMLKIRLTPGMEMLAQELATGRSMFEPEWNEVPPADASPKMWYPYEEERGSAATLPGQPFPYFGSPQTSPAEPASPFPLPFAISPEDGSPSFDAQYRASPHLKPMVRRRSPHWSLDSTGAYPVLFIEKKKVAFYQNMAELAQFIDAEKDRKILLNIANVVSVEKVVAYEVFAQNQLYPDVANGVFSEVPPILLADLSLDLPATFPVLLKPEDKMMFQIKAKGGLAPYKYNIYGQPPDLYVTTDGWLSGYIDAELWPITGYVEFLIRIVVEDSSTPKQTVILDYRYRLFPPAP